MLFNVMEQQHYLLSYESCIMQALSVIPMA